MSRRPRGVTIFAWMAFLLMAIHLTRLIMAVVSWDLLNELLPYWPGYLIFSGLVWAVIGAAFFWGLLRGHHWVRRHLLAAFMAYSIYYWLEFIFIPGDPLRQQNGWFSLGVNILVFVIGVRVFSRPNARAFFGEESHERTTEDQPAA